MLGNLRLQFLYLEYAAVLVIHILFTVLNLGSRKVNVTLSAGKNFILEMDLFVMPSPFKTFESINDEVRPGTQ